MTNQQRRWLKRRQAIEPSIGHPKADHRMNRCWLAGSLGDVLRTVLCWAATGAGCSGWSAAGGSGGPVSPLWAVALQRLLAVLVMLSPSRQRSAPAAAGAN